MPNISKHDEYADISFAIQTLAQKLDRISELEIEVANLKSVSDNSYKHRMSYLTWNLVNPISVICIPIILSLVVELWLNNFGKPVYAWEVESLTRSANWITPIIVATIAIYVTNSNKLYKLIQESGDMSLLSQLRSEMNGLGKRMDRESEKREAKRDAEIAKRDAEIARHTADFQKQHLAFMQSMSDISNRVVRVETITKITELDK